MLGAGPRATHLRVALLSSAASAAGKRLHCRPSQPATTRPDPPPLPPPCQTYATHPSCRMVARESAQSTVGMMIGPYKAKKAGTAGTAPTTGQPLHLLPRMLRRCACAVRGGLPARPPRPLPLSAPHTTPRHTVRRLMPPCAALLVQRRLAAALPRPAARPPPPPPPPTTPRWRPTPPEGAPSAARQALSGRDSRWRRRLW